MIYGVGIDIVKVKRLYNVIERWRELFLKRVFTNREITYCYKKADPFPSFAVRFAAKEALLKSIGKGILNSLTEIEIFNHPSGKPYIKLSGSLKAFFREKKLDTIHLSLSHEKEYAIAAVIIEKNNAVINASSPQM